jgi:two-component system cell cycle response regulator
MRGKSAHVLIVDGDSQSTRPLKRGLRSAGFNVYSTSCGDRALRHCESQPPDAVIIDINLPGMDGFELCERLRSDPLLAETPVIMLTYPHDEMSRRYAVQMTGYAGGDFFLAKPVDLAVLLRLLSDTARAPTIVCDLRRRGFPTQVVWPTRRTAGLATV